MNSKTVTLRSLLSSKLLRYHLRRFFANFFGSDYIAVQTKFFIGNNDAPTQTLGKKFILNVKNRGEVNTYINYVLDEYNTKYVNKYTPEKVTQIRFVYIPVNQNDYALFLDKLNQEKSFTDDIGIGITPLFNIPFNVNYKTWGEFSPRSKDKFDIHNCNFNEGIKILSVFVEDNNNAHVNIVFNDFDKPVESFTDSKMRNGEIKRVFVNGKVYYFNPFNHIPSFYFDDKVLPKVYRKNDKGENMLNERLNVIYPAKTYTKLRQLFEQRVTIVTGEEYQIPELKAITLDIETYYENVKTKKSSYDIHKLLCICFYDGNNVFKFYRGDYLSDKTMLKACFDKLLDVKYKDYTVYIHNGSNFDLIFLLKYLINRENLVVQVIYKDGVFLSLALKFKYQGEGRTKVCTIKVNDSYLILKNSLAKLGKAFNVEIQKDIFPYYFPNSKNLDYIGEVPTYEYFDISKVDKTAFVEYSNRFNKWNLKNEVLNYCGNDCISLYQILEQFKCLIDQKFDVNFQDCPTITSLAFKIFKAKYYNFALNTIPLLNRSIFKDLNLGYSGGHCDMYIPKGPNVNETVQSIMDKYNSLENKSIENVEKQFKLIYHYDVNALYASRMKECLYPTEVIGNFIGDIRSSVEYKNLYENNLGIYKVIVKSPDIRHPLLSKRINNTTVYGHGEWIGWYFSEELKNSEKYGYQFQILGGYIFESKKLFKNYIDNLNIIKETSEKGSAMYTIAKLLMNSLYGRMGMQPFLESHQFISKSDYNKAVKDGIINEVEIEKEDFVSHWLISKPNTSEYGMQGNVAISLAISAYSRVIMSEVKNNNFDIYYSDTDSIICDKPLPDSLVDSKKLGLWKLEDKYIHGIFLAAKVYGAINTKGESFTKVKGYSSQVELSILENLLSKEGVAKLNQEKWRKIMKESQIQVKATVYSLTPTDEKRDLIRSDGVITGTKSKLIKDLELIKKGLTKVSGNAGSKTRSPKNTPKPNEKL